MNKRRSGSLGSLELRATFGDTRRWGQSGLRKELMRIVGHCEVCLIDVPDLLRLHHVKPVSEHGYTWHTNALLLCSNCHSLAHRIRSMSRRGDFDAASYADFHYPHLTDEQKRKLVEIGTSGVE